MSKLQRLPEIAGAFLKLGSMSFGGPVAHLSYLRAEIISKRQWITDEAYADVVALCQFLPGPASSQVAFALGLQRAGILGALTAGVCFVLPSTILMILFAYRVSAIGDLHRASWLHGLKLAAVAVVAQAIWGMGKKLCPDFPRITLAFAAAAASLAIPSSSGQIAAIAAGGLLGWAWYRKAEFPRSETDRSPARHRLWAASALVMFLAILVSLPALADLAGTKEVQLFDHFYRAGSLIFGGGHVMLPLLRAELVPTGWISDDAFVAGYGAAQALPGPLSAFAAYLGTMIGGGVSAWVTGLWCLFALYLPSWLLVAGAFPFWHWLRGRAWVQAALRGANAAVVGVLLAALYNPIGKEGVKNTLDVIFALIAFAVLEFWHLPVWLVVLLCALGALLIYPSPG